MPVIYSILPTMITVAAFLGNFIVTVIQIALGIILAHFVIRRIEKNKKD